MPDVFGLGNAATRRAGSSGFDPAVLYTPDYLEAEVNFRRERVTQRVPDLEGFKDGRPPAGQGLKRVETHR